MPKIKRMICAILAFALLGSIGVCAMAEKKGTINYAVRAMLPENQLNDQVSSFDLKVEPGQRQVLQVAVMNKGDEEIEVAVEANTAFSNSNGLIEFSHTQERDASMAVDFARIVAPVEPVVKVPANGEVVAEFLVTVPEEPFEGVVYGGFMFTKLHQGEDDESEGGMAIRNIYRYAIGVRLRVSEAAVKPAFELTGVEMDPSGKPALLLHLRNPKPVIARGMALRANVYPLNDGEPVVVMEKDNIAMAPNSSMPYRIRLNDAKSLEAGTYRVSVELEFEDHLWQFETSLAVH